MIHEIDDELPFSWPMALLCGALDLIILATGIAGLAALVLLVAALVGTL